VESFLNLHFRKMICNIGNVGIFSMTDNPAYLVQTPLIFPILPTTIDQLTSLFYIKK